jgi:hypothetical protein
MIAALTETLVAVAIAIALYWAAVLWIRRKLAVDLVISVSEERVEVRNRDGDVLVSAPPTVAWTESRGRPAVVGFGSPSTPISPSAACVNIVRCRDEAPPIAGLFEGLLLHLSLEAVGSPSAFVAFLRASPSSTAIEIDVATPGARDWILGELRASTRFRRCKIVG